MNVKFGLVTVQRRGTTTGSEVGPQRSCSLGDLARKSYGVYVYNYVKILWYRQLPKLKINYVESTLLHANDEKYLKNSRGSCESVGCCDHPFKNPKSLTDL